MANSIDVCTQQPMSTNECGILVTCDCEPNSDNTTNTTKTLSASHESVDITGELAAVYESEFGEEDDDESVFADNRLLLGLTRLCKFVVIAFPTVIVLIIILGRLDSDELSQEIRRKVFEIFLVFSVILLIFVFYQFLRCTYNTSNVYRNWLNDQSSHRMDERQRQREELKLQVKNPWRRVHCNQMKKPYFHDVELYKQTGLYSNKMRY